VAGAAPAGDVADDPETTAAGRVTLPIEVLGYRVSTQRVGRQVVYLDELEVEHQVPLIELIRGEFRFDEPTKIYRPRSEVRATIVVENRSRMRDVYVSARLAWISSDGSVLKTQHSGANLPASGEDYRSHKEIDFPYRLEEPGLHQLVARVRVSGGIADKTFRTTIAVTPANPNLLRARSAFFGVHSNLVPEPRTDQMLEINLARQIGAHLVAIEAPWRLIEPKMRDYKFDVLDPLIAAIADKGMAPMMIITEPPEWVEPDPDARARRLGNLLSACAGNFGRRIEFYQCTLGAMGLESPAKQNDVITALQKRLASVQPEARILSAPYPIPASDQASDGPPPKSGPDGPYLTFRTEGDSATALGDLRAFARRHAFEWQRWHWWLHRSEPVVRTGTEYEAIQVLEHYAEAAAAGVAGVIWYDLRDGTADPSHTDDMCGLACRSFCPKMSLLGYATAAGTMAGLRHAGPVPGAADAFDSALFIGSDRQVAVLLPKPNRTLPAVIAPIRGVAGELKVHDFERRRLRVLGSRVPALVSTPARPFFITLDLESAQPEPQLALANPWLKMPAPVFCGSDTSFALEITAPFALGARSFLQLKLPSDCPFDSSLSARGLTAEPGERLHYDVALTPRPGRTFQSAALTVSVSLEGRRVDVPLEVRPLADVRPLERESDLTSAEHRIGRLETDEPDGASADAVLYAGYRRRRLHLAVVLSDNRYVEPGSPRPGEPSEGDELLLGLALEDAEQHVELRIAAAREVAELEPVHGTHAVALRGWRCQGKADQSGTKRTFHIEIPVRSLGVSQLAPGTRLLMAVRYHDDDGGGGERTQFAWGSGLDGSRSTSGFHWLRVVEGSDG
jgi:hypothetical protein